MTTNLNRLISLNEQAPVFLDPVEALGESVVNELTRIQSAIKFEVEEFPRGACTRASSAVYKELSLPRVEGAYCKWPNQNGKVVIKTHAWNETQDGHYYVDLTYQQFNPSAPEIVVICSEFALKFHLHRVRARTSS